VQCPDALFDIFGRQQHHLTGHKIDADVALLFTPEAAPDSQRFVATNGIRKDFLHLVIGLPDLELVVILLVELTACPSVK
jgi:hypothetical protein